MITGYFKLEMLPDEVKTAHKIKIGATVPRYDCTKYAGQKEHIEPFITSKGMFFLRLMEAREFVKANQKRQAEFALVGRSSLNFSSMYAISNVCFYGYPNGKPLLKDGSQNPMFPFRNDLYIILTDKNLSKLEILILPGQKGYALELAQAFDAGDFDDQIESFNENSDVFFKF